jgi:hypothetical protein
LSEANRTKRVLKANLLLEDLRADEGNEFANTMTGKESWFFLSYKSDSMFARTRDEVISRTSHKIGIEKAMVIISLAELNWYVLIVCLEVRNLTSCISRM